MATALSLIILVFALVLFILDRTGKLRLKTTAATGAYMLLIFISALVLVVSAASLAYEPEIIMSMEGASDSVGRIYNGRYTIEDGIILLTQFAAAFPAVIISVVGCVCTVLRKKKETSLWNNIHGELASSAVMASVLSLVSAVAFAVFFCMSALTMLNVMVGNGLIVLMFTLVIAMCTCGLGLIMMFLLFPFILAASGISAVIISLPAVSAAAATGMVFCVFYALTLFYMIVYLKKCCADSLITKKTAVKYGILSVIPLINIFFIIRVKNKSMKASETF